MIRKKNPGQAALVAIMFLLGVAFTLGGSFTSIALRQTASSHTSARSLQSYLAAESGLDDAVYRLKTNKKLGASQTIVVGGATTTVSVLDIIKGKQITATGTFGANLRTEQALLTTDVGADFVYGVEVGSGGIEMDNNSRIEGVDGTAGNVTSFGPITGSSGAVITGSATVSGTIDNVVVNGDVRAVTIGSGAKICGDAYYQSISSTALNFLNSPGNPCPAPLTPGTAHPNQPPTSTAGGLPVSDGLLQGWKEEAGCGQQPASASCLSSGDYTVTSNVNLGPRTITGNLLLNTGNTTLTVDGAIYVRGKIDINGNGASIKCNANYGAKSCVVFADGYIHVQNNVTFAGSGAPGSYLLLLSTAPCDGTPTSTEACHYNGAIDLHNNAAGAIFYASRGMINLHNGVNIKEAIAYKLHLNNNAVVRYETGLINTLFSSGPGGGWRILDWREVE